jgi:breast cancer 2 susceptibility protein
MGFVSATKLPIQDDYRSPSPEEPPPEPDVDAWFNPAPLEALPLFTTAKSIDKADAYRAKAFRSPLIKSVHTSNSVQLPHPLSASVNASPGSASTPQTGFASPLSFMTPLRSSVSQTGFASPSSFMTPLRSSVRPSGMSRTRPAPFVTPFKPGLRPGDPGRSKQGQSSVATTSPLALKAAAKKETPQKGLTKDRPACVLQRKDFFSLGWCTTLFSLMSLTFF